MHERTFTTQAQGSGRLWIKAPKTSLRNSRGTSNAKTSRTGGTECEASPQSSGMLQASRNYLPLIYTTGDRRGADSHQETHGAVCTAVVGGFAKFDVHRRTGIQAADAIPAHSR